MPKYVNAYISIYPNTFRKDINIKLGNFNSPSFNYSERMKYVLVGSGSEFIYSIGFFSFNAIPNIPERTLDLVPENTAPLAIERDKSLVNATDKYHLPLQITLSTQALFLK